ncbi:MAG: EpsG family protein, partial [Porticoccus sp.]|nr:EpsG family protein [Porticoccus sp.]
EKQTYGRGQMGTVWNSEKGKNLIFSVFKDLSMHDVEFPFYISMAISLAIAPIVQNDLIVYSLFAMSALWIKIYVIRQLVATWSILLLIILFYGSRFFPLFELTQIRVALATSFIVLAFLMVTKGRVKFALLFSTISIGFHFSSIVFLPFIVFRKWHFASVISIFFITLLTLAFFSSYTLDQLSGTLLVIAMYDEVGFGDKVNPLAVTVLLDLIMVLVGLVYWRHATQLMRQMLALQLMGVAIFYGVSEYAVLAHRFREMISVGWVLYLAHAFQIKGMCRCYFYMLVIVNIALYVFLFFYQDPLFQK